MADEISVPVIPKPEPFLQQSWRVFKIFLLGSSLGFVAMTSAFYFGGGILLPVAVKMSAVASGIILIAGAALSFLSPPTMSSKESEYRRRINRAIDYFFNKKEIEFDVNTVDDYVKRTLDSGQKEITRVQVINALIEQAREK